MTRLILKAIQAWQSWRTKRRLYREYEWQREYDQQEEDAKRRHMKVSDIRKARRDAMTDALRGGHRGTFR